MSIAKIIEDALRARGVEATVTEAQTGAVNNETASGVGVNHITTSTYTCGAVTVVVKADLCAGAGAGNVICVTVGDDGHGEGTHTFHGEDAHDFLTVMARVLEGMRAA